MSRQIKFRGKTPEGKWVYGNLLNEQTIGEVGNNLSHYRYSTVIPETVGQFTGLRDNNGNEVFEGDKMKKPGSDNIYSVVFFDGAFYLKNGGVNHRLSRTTNDGEIIGSIHDKETEANHG